MSDLYFLLEGSLGAKRTMRKTASLEKKKHFLAATNTYKKYKNRRLVRQGKIKVPDKSDHLTTAEREREKMKKRESDPNQPPVAMHEKEKHKIVLRAALQAQKSKRKGGGPPILRKMKVYKS